MKICDMMYDDFVDNYEVVKEYYEGLLSPFFDVPRIRVLKEKVYSLKVSTKKKDQLWELMNSDITIEEFLGIDILDKTNN